MENDEKKINPGEEETEESVSEEPKAPIEGIVASSEGSQSADSVFGA